MILHLFSVHCLNSPLQVYKNLLASLTQRESHTGHKWDKTRQNSLGLPLSARPATWQPSWLLFQANKTRFLSKWMGRAPELPFKRSPGHKSWTSLQQQLLWRINKERNNIASNPKSVQNCHESHSCQRNNTIGWYLIGLAATIGFWRKKGRDVSSNRHLLVMDFSSLNDLIVPSLSYVCVLSPLPLRASPVPARHVFSSPETWSWSELP